MKRIIYLQKLGEVEPGILIQLKKDLKKIFKKFLISLKLLSDTLPLNDSFYNVKERKYDGTLILNSLENHLKNKNYFSTLGILDRDIFSKNKFKKPTNFVFGIARPRINWETIGVALISISRLREEFYGHKRNKKKERKRILKEAIHELGHTFGLSHCRDYCVMQYSNSLLEADRKPIKFCENCSIILKNFINQIQVSN